MAQDQFGGDLIPNTDAFGGTLVETGAAPAPGPAAPGVISTIKRTGGQMLTTAATAAEDVIGSNTATRAVKETGQGIIDRNPAGIRSLRDLVDSPWLAVKESAAQFAPQIAASAAGGAAGARAGRVFGPAGAAIGGAVGSLVPIFTQEYGGIRQEQQASGQEDKARALAAAIPATALERVGMGKMLDVIKGIPGKPSTILKEMGKGAVREGATEGAQNMVEQWGAFKNPTTSENLEDTALSAAMGAIGGGVMGAGAGVVDGARARGQQKAADQQASVDASASQSVGDGVQDLHPTSSTGLPDVAEYGGLIDQMVKPENQQQYRDTLARALDEQRPAEERKAAADALHQAFNPEQFQRSQAAAPTADPAGATAPAAPPAINPADGPMSKAAVMAGDLGLAPITPPAPPSAPDVRQQLGAALDQLSPEQQRAARMTLADLERADLPAGVRAMRESEARALIPAPTPSDQEVLAGMESGRVVRTFEPQPADLSDVASYAGLIDSMVRPEAQPAFRQALATAQDQTLPLSVRSEAENALHANFAPAAYQRARQANPDARLSLQPVAAPSYGNGIDFTTEARREDPAAARIAALAVADGRTPGEPMRLNEAHALRQRAAQDGIAVSVVPHPSGRGFDVQPTLRLSPQERNQVPATAEAGALTFDPAPTGRMVAGPEGVRPETRAEAVARINAAQAERLALEAERQRRADLGMSNITPVRPLPAEPTTPALAYDNAPTGRMLAGADGVRQERRAEVVNRANEPTPVPDTVTSAGGAPFTSQQAAQRELQRRELTGSHEVVPASGDASLGYVLQKKGRGDPAPQMRGNPAFEGQAERAPNWRTNALQAARVARSLDLDVRGMSLQRMVAAVDAADAARTRQDQPDVIRTLGIDRPQGGTSEKVTQGEGAAGQSGASSTKAPMAANAPETVMAGADKSSAVDQRSAPQRREQQQDRSGPARPADVSTGQNRRSVGFPEAAPAAQQSGRIEDFGETLPGARKMLYAEAYADGMAKAKELDVKAHPLSKTWPEPDYAKLLEGGTAPDTVALARALRDAVPTKPQSTWKLRGWSDRVTMLRGFADDLLSGRNDPAAVRAELHRDSIPRGIANQAALYEAVGHERSLKDIKLDAGRYSMYEGVAYDLPRTIWTVSRAAKASSFNNWPRELAKGDTRETAIEAFKRRSAELLAEQGAPVRGASFEIYSKRAGGAREFFVGKKIGRNVAELKTGFPDVKAARAYLADNQTELENLLQRYKDVPPVRNSQNAPRIGQDYRKGGDATPEQFQEAFGFRGVQFGNYVERPRRQQDLNRAYDALMDLAGVLNLPPRALSLGGRLGLAFGARGSGGQNAAAAHYEPGSVVINLTKREGAGSLAHEWWHALDNYFSRQRGDGAGYMTAEERQGQGVREEMRTAFREVRSAINRTGMLERSKKLDDRRTKEYWTTKPEMSARAFESYVVAKLQDQSAGNDYLANIVPAGVFALEGAYPYPTAGEMPQIRGAFDAFFQAVEKRQEGDGSVSLYSTGDTGPGRGLSLEDAQQAVKQALAGLRNPPPVDVVLRAADLGQGEPDYVKGVRMPDGRLAVVASAHSSPLDVVETVFHELFHQGLRNIVADPVYVQTMLDLAKRDSRVQQYAIRWKQFSPDAPAQLEALKAAGHKGSTLNGYFEALSIEEGLAVVAEELRAQKQAGTRMGLRVRTLANWLASVADRLGMERLGAAIRKMTYNEAERFVMKAIDNAGSAPLNGAATVGPDISRYRTAPAAAVESSMGEMTPVQEKVWKKVAGTATVPTLKQRAEALRQNFAVRAKQALVDQFAPIQDVSQEAYMLARMSKGADGTMEAAMLYGRPFLRDGVPDVNVKEGGFANVLASLKGEQDRFLWWVAAQRAGRLKAEGKENLMSVDDIGVLKTLNAGNMADGTNRAPVYAKAMADLNSFNEGVLKMALDSGLIDQSAYDLFRDQPYVPFYRLMADGEMQGRRFSSGLVNQKAWQKLKGGTEKLNADLLQNTLLNWSHLYAAAARNRAALATMDAAEKLGVAYPVQEGTKGAVKVMRNGEAQHWTIEDPYLLEAVSALNYTASPLMKPLAKMKQVLTFGVTVNPTFKIRNLIRDSLSAIAQSELGYNPAANVARGWKLTARDSQTYASMLASGGIIKFGTQENTDRLRDQVAKLGGVVLDRQGWKKLTGQLSTVWNAYSELGDRAENVNRAALYDRLVAKGHSHAEASFMARDLMDFSMSGNHAVVRFLTQSVPFLNARLQGLYKLGRAAHDNPRRFAMVAGAVSLASLGLMAAYSDDDDWKKREDWDRDSYWWFKIGGTAYRIPKPFEVGAIGTLAERTAELMMSDEMTGERFRQRLAHMVSQTFSFDPMPQAFKPLIDIYSNKDSFTGRAIESQADQRLRSQDRYDERTSEVARMLGSWGLPDPARLLKGEWADLSPKQVDYLLRGYFSWAGTTAVAAADAIARPALDRGERPDMRLKDVFVVGNFAESLPSGSSRYVTQMYEQAKQVEQAYASYRDALKRGDLEKAQEIMRDEAPKLQHRAAFNNASERLAALNQRSKAITADPSMSGEEKRQRLDTIERLRAEIGHRMSALSIAP